MYRFDNARLDLAREFKASPFGEHSPDLQYLLHIMRQPGTDPQLTPSASTAICVHYEWITWRA